MGPEVVRSDSMNRNTKIAAGVGLLTLAGGLTIWGLTRKAEAKPPPPPPPGYANLWGVVRDSITTDRLYGVTVTANGYTAMTGADGRYDIYSIPVGEYTVVFSLLGYSDRTMTKTVVEGNNQCNALLDKELSQLLIDMRWDLYIVMWNIRHGFGDRTDDYSDYGWGIITYYEAEPLLKQAMIDEAIRLGIISSGSECYFTDSGAMYHINGKRIV